MATFLQTVLKALNPEPRESWFDGTRFHDETTAVRQAFAGNITLRLLPGAAPGHWESYGVVFTYDEFTITGKFDPSHPYKPPRFQISPEPQSIHYYDDGRGKHLCFCRPEEWQPGFMMATAVGEVIRFLTEYQQGVGKCSRYTSS